MCQYGPVFRGHHRLHAAGNDSWRAQDCLSGGGRTRFLPAPEHQIGPCGEDSHRYTHDVILKYVMSYSHDIIYSLFPDGQWSETIDLRPQTSCRHTTEAVNGCWGTSDTKFIFIHSQSWFWRSGASDLYIITVFMLDVKMQKNPEEIEYTHALLIWIKYSLLISTAID